MTAVGSRAVRLFVVTWLVYTVHWSPFVVREHFPAITLAEDGTLNAERFLDVNSDIFRSARGGAYINNNPGASIAGALPLFVSRPLLRVVERLNTRRPTPDVDPRLDALVYLKAVDQHREWYFLAVAFITVAGLMAPITALAVAALYWWLVDRGGVPSRESFVASVMLALGTPYFMRTGYLSHNQLVAIAALLAFLLLADKPSRRLTAARAAVAGGLCGFAVLCDYTGLLVALMMVVYLWVRRTSTEGLSRIALSGWFAAGATPGVLLLLGYQWLAFGAPALPAQHFMPPIEPTAHGYRGIDWPSLELAWMNFFDPYFGLFVYCPVLVLAVAAPLVRSVPHAVPLREQWFLLAFAGLFVLFCAANQYSRLQWNTGVRYLVPTIPALLVLSLHVLQALPRVVSLTLMSASIALNTVVAIARDRLAGVFSQEGLQFSWAHRMAELDMLERPQMVTLMVLTALAIVVCASWRRELTCAS